MRKYVLLIIVALLVGIWFGVNIARDRPLLSNPFKENTLGEKATNTAKELYRDSKEAIKKQLD